MHWSDLQCAYSYTQAWKPLDVGTLKRLKEFSETVLLSVVVLRKTVESVVWTITPCCSVHILAPLSFIIATQCHFNFYFTAVIRVNDRKFCRKGNRHTHWAVSIISPSKLLSSPMPCVNLMLQIWCLVCLCKEIWWNSLVYLLRLWWGNWYPLHWDTLQGTTVETLGSTASEKLN